MDYFPIRNVEGDLFNSFSPDIEIGRQILIPHVVNNVGAWGAGFVLAISKRFPKVEMEYIRWANSDKSGDFEGPDFALGNVLYSYTSDEEVVIAHMCAQNGLGMHNGRLPIRFGHLVWCMQQVRDYCMDNSIQEIRCPRFGCGLAGGSWDVVKNLIEDIWTPNLQVVVYSL